MSTSVSKRFSEPAAVASTQATRRKWLRYIGRCEVRRRRGRGKPASEYLVRAAENGKLTSINAAVDVCNVVSLHSGLPISMIDLDRAEGDLRIRIADKGVRYVFNRSGQEIDLGGLLCLYDDRGPCANAVKDSQRTKTDEDTRNTVSLIWGTRELAGKAGEAAVWYRELLERLGGRTASL